MKRLNFGFSLENEPLRCHTVLMLRTRDGPLLQARATLFRQGLHRICRRGPLLAVTLQKHLDQFGLPPHTGFKIDLLYIPACCVDADPGFLRICFHTLTLEQGDGNPGFR